MKHKNKIFFTTPFVCLILIISLLALPINASAKTGTLGTENPIISCTFTDAGGNSACGDHLEKGMYTVDFVMSGMASVSILQIMADYDNTKLADIELVSSNPNFLLGGQAVSSNSLAAFVVSNSSNTTTINSQGTVMFTYRMNVLTAGDFADMMQLSTDPNSTFAEADYGDGYYDCYVLDTTIEYTAGTTYASTADVSPYIAPTVFRALGKITLAKDVSGTASNYGMPGVTVAVDGEGISSTTDDTGAYVLGGLAPGSYSLTISSECSADRKATLVVSADNADYDAITVDNVGIVPCDYNKDSYINATDVFLFSRRAATDSTKSDLNKDGIIDESDVDIFKTSFLGKSVEYSSVSLK